MQLIYYNITCSGYKNTLKCRKQGVCDIQKYLKLYRMEQIWNLQILKGKISELCFFFIPLGKNAFKRTIFSYLLIEEKPTK